MTLKLRLFVFGLLAAIAVYCVGDYFIDEEAKALESLINTCNAESDRMKKSVLDDTWQKSFTLDCDPNTLTDNQSLKGVQAQIVRVRSALAMYKKWLTPTAFLVLAAFAAPFAWHFLLARITELRKAIVGK